MGIKGLFKVLASNAITHTDKDYKGMSIGIDMSDAIFRASLGMKSLKGLTDSDGNPTVLLNIIMCNVSKYKKKGIRGLIYVFDNPYVSPLKSVEHKKRKAARLKAQELCELTDNKDQMEKRTFSITSAMITDVQYMLNLLGVSWIVAPKGYEAEHLGARLTELKIIDTFITSDSDTLLFGGLSMTRRIPSNKYEEYKLSDVLSTHSITREQLVRIGVILGCDFAIKTPGVGPGTVLKKYENIKLTDDQEVAVNYFLSECPYEESMIMRGKKNIPELIEWLVQKNFNKVRITKILSVL